MKGKLLPMMLLLLGVLLPSACQRTQQDQYYGYNQSDAWRGPGWYYGIYFTNEAQYRNWHNRHHHHNRSYGDRRADHYGYHHDGGHYHGRRGRH